MRAKRWTVWWCGSFPALMLAPVNCASRPPGRTERRHRRRSWLSARPRGFGGEGEHAVGRGFQAAGQSVRRQGGVLVVVQSARCAGVCRPVRSRSVRSGAGCNRYWRRADNVAGIGDRLKQNHAKHARLRLEGDEDSTLDVRNLRSKLFLLRWRVLGAVRLSAGMMIGRPGDPQPVLLRTCQRRWFVRPGR